MVFAQNQNVIQQFTRDAADEALTHGIGFGCSHRCVDHLDTGSGCDTLESGAILAIIVADEKTRPFIERCGFA